MLRIAKATLSFSEISDYWSREISPPASSNELLDTLVSAWWLGELRADFVHSRLEYLKKMFTSKYRDDRRMVFIVGDDARLPAVALPGVPVKVDLRPTVRLPSSNIDSWDEAACRDAFSDLAQISSLQNYPDFTIGLSLTKLTYEEFDTWRTNYNFSPIKFWQQPRDQPVAPQQERKTWQAKPGRLLTASEKAICGAINEIWPDGVILDLKAKARDERILSKLKSARQHAVSSRTIQRTLKKICFR
jgi:hypothetical protein